MEAKDFSEWMAASALEGPSSSEASVAGARVVRLIALGASMSELDPRALQGVDFLFDRIRAEFTTPALATESSEELLELWRQVSGSVLRLMDAVAVLLFEAGQANPSDVIFRRLERSDRHAFMSAASLFDERGSHVGAEEIRRSITLVERARARLRERADQRGDEDLDLLLIKGFHRGILVWTLGMLLCLGISDQLDGLVPETIRPDLVDDAVEFATAGARMAAWFAAVIAGLGVLEFASAPEVRSALEQTNFIAFLLQATTEVPRVFGGEVRYALTLFRYPDEPDAFEFHLVIDTHAPPNKACELLDELCDSWWDEAAAELEVEVFPVLGVLNDE